METIIENFPYPIIPKIKGKPDRKDLEKLQKMIFANATAIESTLGGGAHGYLGIAMEDAEYHTLTGAHFVRPPNPGLTPTIPAGATQHVILATQNNHQASLKQYKECNLIERALKNQIINAIDSLYLEALEEDYVGYKNRSIIDLFTHLFDNYGIISNKDLADNEAKLLEEWETETPIEHLFKRIEKVANYATKAGDTFTETKKIAAAYNLIKKTQEFDNACRSWRLKPIAQKTWQNFKNDFSEEYTAYAEDLQEKHGGFDKINLVQKQVDVLQEIRDATLADKENNQYLNNVLLNKIEDKNSEISKLKTLLTAVSNKIDKLSPTYQNQSTTQNNKTRSENFFKYCWSHGRTGNPLHTSMTCTARKEGHKADATICNRQGGLNKGCGYTGS